MADSIYTTDQFDELDAICSRHYGGTQGTVEAVLAVNPNLADLLPILPQGVRILLPELPDPARRPTVIRFWEP